MKRKYYYTAILCLSIFLISVSQAEPKNKKVFIKNNEIWIVDNQALNPRQLTEDGTDKDNPALSPDETRIAYNVGKFIKEKRIIIIGLEGQLIKTLNVSQEAGKKSIDKLEWLDNDKIGIEVHLNPWYGAYQVIDTTTGEMIADFWGGNFVWSPDRSKIAYALPNYIRDAHGNLISSDVLSINDITAYPVDDTPNEVYPSKDDPHKHHFKTEFYWSPNGNYLAFIDEHEEDSKREYLVLLNLKNEISVSQTLIPLTIGDFGNNPDDYLKWSKDSRTITLYRGNKELWVVNVLLETEKLNLQKIIFVLFIALLILVLLYISFSWYKRSSRGHRILLS